MGKSRTENKKNDELERTKKLLSTSSSGIFRHIAEFFTEPLEPSSKVTSNNDIRNLFSEYA
jgi:hypothetical protein